MEPHGLEYILPALSSEEYIFIKRKHSNLDENLINYSIILFLASNYYIIHDMTNQTGKK